MEALVSGQQLGVPEPRVTPELNDNVDEISVDLSDPAGAAGHSKLN